MHAVVVKVRIEDLETARKHLQERVVPRASQAPGFVAGYWTRSADGGDGLSMVLFDSEDSANTAVEMVRAAAEENEGVSLEGVEVREVVANA
jgi:hypothetical protein